MLVYISTIPLTVVDLVVMLATIVIVSFAPNPNGVMIVLVIVQSG